MNKARIKEQAEHFFDGPSKRRDNVTLTSCLIFAEVIAGMAVDAEREACAQIGDGYDYGDRNCGDEIRARGMK